MKSILRRNEVRQANYKVTRSKIRDNFFSILFKGKKLEHGSSTGVLDAAAREKYERENGGKPAYFDATTYRNQDLDERRQGKDAAPLAEPREVFMQTGPLATLSGIQKELIGLADVRLPRSDAVFNSETAEKNAQAKLKAEFEWLFQ